MVIPPMVSRGRSVIGRESRATGRRDALHRDGRRRDTARPDSSRDAPTDALAHTTRHDTHPERCPVGVGVARAVSGEKGAELAVACAACACEITA